VDSLLPVDFVEAVENDNFALEEPPSDAYRNNGMPFNSTDQPDFERQEQIVTEIKKKLRTTASDNRTERPTSRVRT